jgi:hypothetical protein
MPRRLRTAVASLTAVTLAAALVASATGPAAARPASQPARPAQPLSLAAASKPLPSHDPFYKYFGAKGPLAKITPGTVLKHRKVTISLGQNASPVPGYQLLYRTKTERSRPSVTVTTILTPSTALAVPRVVAYLSFYDALGSECDPSYTLTGGYAGTSGNEQQAEEEQAILSAYLAEGDILTVPDYEGTGLHWAAGHESGWNTIDALRATENFLHLARSTPIGLTGYSGGSIAGEWASELVARYAPKLHIVGVAEGGIPVDLWHNLRYINGKKTWSGVIPAVLLSIGKRAFGVKLRRFLDAKGRRITHRVRNQCIGSFSDSYPGLTAQSLLKPRYRQLLADRFFVHIVNRLLMGTVPGHPRMPLFMAVGNADGTGDGVMVAKDVQGLAHEYCTQGAQVQFSEYQGDSHTQAAVPFETTALQFLQQRLDGVPFQKQSCASIGKGNSLHRVRLHHRRR